jgi:hypothetical protein
MTMGTSRSHVAGAWAVALGFAVPAFAGEPLPPPPVPSSIDHLYKGPRACPAPAPVVDPLFQPVAPPPLLVLVPLEAKPKAADPAPGPAVKRFDDEKWIFKLCEQAYKDLVGVALPADARENAEKAFRAFKEKDKVHLGETGPKGAIVFFADELAISNGNGTVIGIAPTGWGVDPSIPVAKIGKPLGWVQDPSLSGGGGTATGTTGPGVAAVTGGVEAPASTPAPPPVDHLAPAPAPAPARAPTPDDAPHVGPYPGGTPTSLPPALAAIMVRACQIDGLPVSWASSPQLAEVLNKESGFSPTAQNPTSTAYGLFQFLDSTWAGVGATKTSDPLQQCVAGLKYIQQRYGSPAGAWQHELDYNWY